MKKNLKRAALVALVLVIVGAIISAIGGSSNALPSKGQTQTVVKDGCINYAEFIGPSPTQLSRGPVETFYGIRGAGKQVSSQNHGKNIIVMYPACNKTTHQAFYEISYSRNKVGIYKAGYLTQFVGFEGARKGL